MSGEPQQAQELPGVQQPQEPRLPQQPLASPSLAEEEERHLQQLASTGGSAAAREAVREDLESWHFVSAGMQIDGGLDAVTGGRPLS